MLQALVRRHWFPTLLLLLAGILAYQNLVLARANRLLQQHIVKSAAQEVEVGDRLGILSGVTPDGASVRHSFEAGSDGALVIGISAGCGICFKNLAAWRRVARVARDSGLRIVWVSRDVRERMREFLGESEAADTVMAEPTYGTYVQLKLQSVPRTLVVESNGRVSAVIPGLLDPAAEDKLVLAIRTERTLQGG